MTDLLAFVCIALIGGYLLKNNLTHLNFSDEINTCAQGFMANLSLLRSTISCDLDMFKAHVTHTRGTGSCYSPPLIIPQPLQNAWRCGGNFLNSVLSIAIQL